MGNSQRLQILLDEDIDELYSRPIFNDPERSHFFSLPEKVLVHLKLKKLNGKRVSSCLYFILQYGYFKARHQFFNLEYSELVEDVSFILKQYMPNDHVPTKPPSRKIQYETRSKILDLMEFIDNKKISDQLIIKCVGGLAKTTNNLLDIFEKTTKYLDDNLVVLPFISSISAYVF